VPRLCAAVIIERYNAGRGRNIEEFFVRVPAISTAGTAYDRSKRYRAEIRRRAARSGDDLSAARNIPRSMRRAFGEGRVAAAAQRQTALAGHDELPHTDAEGESPAAGVPDLAGVRRAFQNGRGIRWVMDAWGLDYETAKAIRAQLDAA
jgi:hypothetical protein